MTNRPGMGVMIRMLGGNEENVAAWKASEGKEIASLKIDPAANDGDGALIFGFTDGTRMAIQDLGRSCCEGRWMHTDDDLSEHVGSKLLDAEIREGPTVMEHGEPKECSFLWITTSAGRFVVNTYNEHNGYYGGFWIQAVAMPDSSP